MAKLVIVESPAKARTISQFLGLGFVVRASYGHVRDLPENRLAIDVEHQFKPEYVIIPKAKKILQELKKELKDATELYLATDLDREGEAIAWHVVEALGLGKLKGEKEKLKIKRIIFHEITKRAIDQALSQPSAINQRLIDAQQARRILDRLVGYKLSPLLWKKVYRGLSAGRVQSVAVRLVVEREREVKAFKPREYWTIEALARAAAGEFKALLASQDSLSPAEFPDRSAVDRLIKKLTRREWQLAKLERSQSTQKPQPPLITSTLQQLAARVLHFPAKKTMRVAQDLYEGIEVPRRGSVALITYMRTDSFHLSEESVTQAAKLIGEYGQKYLPQTPNKFDRKVKGAQEAHEAIRPTDFTIRPEDLEGKVSRDYHRLYQLIWRSAVASQMAPAVIESETATVVNKEEERLIGRGRRLLFDGFLKLYPEAEERFDPLPALKEGEEIKLKKIAGLQHFTEPPARYSEATLVKELEERGIGRPSTYAPIMGTIVDRGYVSKKTGRFFPEPVAEVVTDLLKEHFPEIVDYDFTAEMEDDLDRIAEGEKGMTKVLDEFYRPFAKLLSEKEKSIDKKSLVEEKTDQKCPKSDHPVVIKLGRFGKFYACSGYPECDYTAPYLDDDFTKKEEKIIAEEAKEDCPKCRHPLTVRQGKFGTFLGCSSYPKCDFTKPIVIPIQVKCPNCGQDLIRKSSRRGRVFWGCSGYPKCQVAFWDEPIDRRCPNCRNLLVKKKNGIKCSQCDYEETSEKAVETAVS